MGRAINKQYAGSTEYELVNTDVEKCEQEEDLAFRINAINLVRDILLCAVKRPAYSILENYMFKMTTDFMFADWHDAIAEYLKEA